MDILYLIYHELRRASANYAYVVDTDLFSEHCRLFRHLQAADGSLEPRVTFDDGHLSNFELALPILSDHGLRAHFFITVGWVGTRPGYMDWSQVRALHRAGHSVGAHGWSHTLLTHCDDRQLERELHEARTLLEGKIDAPVTTMSLPGGRMNRRVIDRCWQAGYETVFTSNPGASPANAASHTLRGRLNVRNSTGVDWLEQVLRPESGILRNLTRKERLKHLSRLALGDTLYAKLWSVLNRQEVGADEDAPA